MRENRRDKRASEQGRSDLDQTAEFRRSAPTVIVSLVSWSENKQGQLKLWSQKQLQAPQAFFFFFGGRGGAELHKEKK